MQSPAQVTQAHNGTQPVLVGDCAEPDPRCEHPRPAPKDPAPIRGAVDTKSAALFSDTDVGLKTVAFQWCDELTTPARHPVW